MERIASFEQFKKNGASMDEYSSKIAEPTNESNNDDRKHYMFFRNLASIKHNIEEILKMDPDQIDDMLENGHDWAADHIATSKDDIQEVTEWLRGEFEDNTESDDEDEDDEETEEETVTEEPDGEEKETEEETEVEKPEGEEESKQQI